MRKLANVVNLWPLPIGALLSSALIATAAVEKVDLPDWLLEVFERSEEPPKVPSDPKPSPAPRSIAVPYAPAPGRDDRTPLAFVSQVFGLGDDALPAKLSGVGPTFWRHSGHGTGALIAPDVVLTTGHLFAEAGQWDGPFGLTHKAPPPSDGSIYLEACGKAYPFKAIHLGAMAPRKRLGLDYAISELATPACAAAQVLPVAETPNDLHGDPAQTLLNIGAYRFRDLPRYAQHPLFADQAKDPGQFARFSVFGVRCRATTHMDTGDVPKGSTGLVITSGCDGVPGGSGGPLVVSRDGGASYAIVGVANSYRKTDAEYNNYTAIEGAFVAHLGQFADVIELPETVSSSQPSSFDPVTIDRGPWHAMTRGLIQEFPQ